MLILSTSKYILWSCSFLFVLSSSTLYAQTSDADTSEDVKVKENYNHQLSISFDAYQVLANTLVNYRTGYELAADYYLKNEIYGVAEAGWGASNINYTDLAYTTTNNFFRVGVNKSLLERMSPQDWDMMFVGIRYGMAFISRSQATYIVADSLWGNTGGTIAGKSLTAYWAEICGGMKVELLKGFCVGYTIRGKFLMNAKALKDLAPQYIAGYGRGDKTAVFDFNLYLSYAIRWKHGHEILKTAKAH